MGERSDAMFKTTGSKLLLPVSEYLGFPLDQVNFIACQLFGLAVAFWFRLYLKPSHFNPLVRHTVATLLGVTFLVFCFGWYATHILAIVVAIYVIILKADINHVHRYSMVTAMGYLTVCQVSRVFIFNYGVLSTDFSGPLMMVTQRITTLVFQLHDGMCKKSEQLTSEQKLLAIRERPSLIEYLSYNLNFLSILVGPCSNYRDYIDFIEGRHISRRLKQHSGSCNGHNGYDKTPDPSPLNAVCRKLLVCCGCMLTFLIVTRSLPINEAQILLCLDAGVCYDRAPKHRLALTFILSALWHGVYPGYYFTFLTAIPITMAARAIRKRVRHHFLNSKGLKLGYDIVTWAATQLAICYTVMPFLLLSIDQTLIYYRSMYFHVHILSILAVITLHGKHKPKDASSVSTKSPPPVSSSSPDLCQPVPCNNNHKNA
uniref:Membrane bound O-acyltransferase domain containing 1 n=1 Tax=Oryzias sinensis TaxID=183150 RepID=A0A8C7ZW07_9TELE